MKMMKTICITSSILLSSSVFAQDTAQQNAAPYGDNPNIFKVLSHKAQQSVQNTVEKVDLAAQKGIEKVKPKVANAWEETKVLGAETSAVAKEKSQQAAATINQKVNKTRDGIMGNPNDQPAPIVSHPLSQSSTSVESAPIQQPIAETPQTHSNTSTAL